MFIDKRTNVLKSVDIIQQIRYYNKKESFRGGEYMVSALNVANNILDRGFSEGIDITPMKLQKLTYLVYKKILSGYEKSIIY